MGRRQGGKRRGHGPIADYDAADGAALGPQAAYYLDEPIPALLGRQRTHEYKRKPAGLPLAGGTGGLVRWYYYRSGVATNCPAHLFNTSSPTAATSPACATTSSPSNTM